MNKVTSLIRADAEVLNVRQLDGSKTICIIFAGKKLPTRVKLGYVRYSVRHTKVDHLNALNATNLVKSLQAASIATAARNVQAHMPPQLAHKIRRSTSTASSLTMLLPQPAPTFVEKKRYASFALMSSLDILMLVVP